MSDWIRVEDRSPNSARTPHKDVIVYIPDAPINQVRLGFYNGFDWRVQFAKRPWNVTHWMPLPEPPK